MLKRVALFISLFFTLQALAQKFQVPWLNSPVVDEVGLLTSAQKQNLERQLYEFKKQNGSQVQVFIAKSLQGLEIEQASIEIVDQWKLGGVKDDRGLLFLIAPNERKLRIEVGQGLEGIMPDAYAKRITDDVVIPYFRQGQMALGVEKGTQAILAVLAGEPLTEAQAGSAHAKGLGKGPLLFIILWILFFIFTRFGGGGGRRSRLRDNLMAGALGYGLGRSSSWGGGSSGGGWSGGGGGFSGGGASGSW